MYETPKEFQGKSYLNAFHKGEEPITEFVNAYDASRVKLLAGIPAMNLYHAMFTFIMGSFGNSPHKLEELNPAIIEERKVVEACLNGEALPLAMEIPVFTFKIYGVDRIFTHQIVRSRIGVTFSQHCTGDNDVRHAQMLLPHPIITAEVSSERYEYRSRIEKHLIEAKKLYAEGIDKFGLSIEDARHIMPHCTSTYIYMHCNYMMLRNFIGRRWCANETPHMQRVCLLIKEEVSRVYPLLGKYLMGNCDVTKRCHFKKNNSVLGGAVFFGCGKHPRIGSDGKDLENDPRAYMHSSTGAKHRCIATEGTKDHSIKE